MWARQKVQNTYLILVEGPGCLCREEERWACGQLKCLNGLSKASEEKMSTECSGRCKSRLQLGRFAFVVAFCCDTVIYMRKIIWWFTGGL